MKPRMQDRVTLPGSKSESNRALMIAAYGGFPAQVDRLSEAHDTQLLQSLLNTIAASKGTGPVRIDCEDAGAAARFLLPLLCGRPGTWLMTGTERMCQRPMAPVVDAMRQLGAEITYQRAEGHLPLLVKGKPMVGGTVAVDAFQSSQFVSALLMAAPMWKEGLRLHLTGREASAPYVAMTCAIMRHYGAEVQRHGPVLEVAPKPYQETRFEVAADWSAASYWYEWVALHGGRPLVLEGLRPDPLQGDAIVSRWYELFGVRTEFGPCGATLTKEEIIDNQCDIHLHFDFSEVPDLFPAVFVTCVALHRPAVFTGVKNLRLKESDRVRCLVTELEKIYTFINIIGEDEISIEKSSLLYDVDWYKKRILFNTYSDHRIAMAVAPLKTFFSGLVIDHPEVVAKSYPNYWAELEKVTGM